jgi:hypothetical protein
LLLAACSSSSTNPAAAGGGGTGAGGGGGAAGAGGSATGGAAGLGGTGTGGGGGSGGVSATPCKKSSAAPALYDCAPAKAQNPAVDETNVYFVVRSGSGQSVLHRAPKDGSAAESTPWATLTSALVGDVLIDADNDAIYVGTNDPARALLRYDRNTGAEQALVTALDCAQHYQWGALAQNATSVFFTCSNTHSILALPKTGSAGTVVAKFPAPVDISGLAAGPSKVYVAKGDFAWAWANSSGDITNGPGWMRVAHGGGYVYALKATEIISYVDGGSSSPFVAGLLGATDLEADATGIAVIGSGAGANDGWVLGRTHVGATTKTYASGGSPSGVALDAASVYWTDAKAGTVNKLAR